MAIIDTAVKALADRRIGEGGVHFLFGEPKNFVGRSARQEWEEAELDFKALVDSIDWNRLLIEGTAIHLKKGIKHADETYEDQICGECIKEALLRE